MSGIDDARRSLDHAQGLLDQANGDIARFDEFLGWLDGAIARSHELDAYARDQGPADLATVLADDEQAVTPPVVNEDAAWEATADFHDRLLRLLRVVTAELTSGLDTSD